MEFTFNTHLSRELDDVDVTVAFSAYEMVHEEEPYIEIVEMVANVPHGEHVLEMDYNKDEKALDRFWDSQLEDARSCAYDVLQSQRDMVADPRMDEQRMGLR